MLIIFGGLPGTGKTTLAKEVSKRLKATYLRIDTIEQAIKTTFHMSDVRDAGYVIGYALAQENLLAGQTVIADSVNPVEITRKAWLNIATLAQCNSLEIEVICSDKREHQKRVETRSADIPGHQLPDWQKVITREFEPWKNDHIIIDTAGKSAREAVEELLGKIRL